MFKEIKSVLESNGYKVTCCDGAADAAKYLNVEINGKTVGIGGSKTVEEIGLYDKLASHNTVYWTQDLKKI